MATGGVRRLYEEDDKVDEYLLNQVSKWVLYTDFDTHTSSSLNHLGQECKSVVLYHRIGSLARDLGISQAQFSRIIGAKSEPEEQNFQVISGNLLPLASRDFLSRTTLVWQDYD